MKQQLIAPTRMEFLRGCQEFQLQESRQAMYKVATYLVAEFWGRPTEMTDALGVLLLTWNQAFYRYGSFSFNRLESCVRSNLPVLKGYRDRSILSLEPGDESNIEKLFDQFCDALAIERGKRQGYRSPVATAKALHLLAPSYFPLWDKAIADAYGCCYSVGPAASYIKFFRITAKMAREIDSYSPGDTVFLPKRIDEYNYARFTKGWVR